MRNIYSQVILTIICLTLIVGVTSLVRHHNAIVAGAIPINIVTWPGANLTVDLASGGGGGSITGSVSVNNWPDNQDVTVTNTPNVNIANQPVSITGEVCIAESCGDIPTPPTPETTLTANVDNLRAIGGNIGIAQNYQQVDITVTNGTGTPTYTPVQGWTVSYLSSTGNVYSYAVVASISESDNGSGTLVFSENGATVSIAVSRHWYTAGPTQQLDNETTAGWEKHLSPGSTIPTNFTSPSLSASPTSTQSFWTSKTYSMTQTSMITVSGDPYTQETATTTNIILSYYGTQYGSFEVTVPDATPTPPDPQPTTTLSLDKPCIQLVSGASNPTGVLLGGNTVVVTVSNGTGAPTATTTSTYWSISGPTESGNQYTFTLSPGIGAINDVEDGTVRFTQNSAVIDLEIKRTWILEATNDVVYVSDPATSLFNYDWHFNGPALHSNFYSQAAVTYTGDPQFANRINSAVVDGWDATTFRVKWDINVSPVPVGQEVYNTFTVSGTNIAGGPMLQRVADTLRK